VGVVPAVRRIFLLQGDIYCEAQPALVSTILGSCVSVCLWDSHLHVGGINHYVLPEAAAETETGNARYGSVAISRLLQRMLELGSRNHHLQAKIFGGASVFPLGAAQVTVGERNVDLAVARLQAFRIPVTAQRTGGHLGRQISFHTATGEASVRELVDVTKDTLPVA